MSEPRDLPAWSREELLALVVELPRQLTEWHAELDQCTRGGKRQAAPFSTGTRVAEPKPPGRQPGAGPFRYREAPPPEAITALPVDVKVTRAACPACGGPLAAQAWPDGIGMPVRNVPTVVRLLTGVQLTQGPLTQDALRRAAGVVGTADAQWRAAIPQAPVVPTDDTGWRVGGEPAFLMAFETEAATVSQVRPRHRHEEGPEVMPADDVGVLVTDGGRSDAAQAFDNVRQHTCLAHIQRSLSEVLETKPGRARDLGEGRQARRQDALQRWHAYHEGSATDVVTDANALREALTDQLRDRPRKDADHQRRLNALGWHHDRGNLVRFLDAPRIEPTNPRAARALRPAVIARKVSQGSQNSRGTHAFEAFTRVVRTLTTQGIDSLVEGLSHLFRFPSIQDVSP